jgi:hypothetical protein
MDEHPKARTDPPALNVFGIHIPPEEAVALALVVVEVAADAWARQRNTYSMKMLTFRRKLEFAVAHEGGFRTLVRNSRFYPKP